MWSGVSSRTPRKYMKHVSSHSTLREGIRFIRGFYQKRRYAGLRRSNSIRNRTRVCHDLCSLGPVKAGESRETWRADDNSGVKSTTFGIMCSADAAFRAFTIVTSANVAIDPQTRVSCSVTCAPSQHAVFMPGTSRLHNPAKSNYDPPHDKPGTQGTHRHTFSLQAHYEQVEVILKRQVESVAGY